MFKHLKITMALAIVSSILGSTITLSAAGLKGINIGDDFKSSCDKLDIVYANIKNVKIQRTVDRCGFDSLYFGFFGIVSHDQSTIDYIKLPVILFGLSPALDSQTLTYNAQTYLESKDAVIKNFNIIRNGKYPYYYGYDSSTNEEVRIDFNSIVLMLQTRVNNTMQ